MSSSNKLLNGLMYQTFKQKLLKASGAHQTHILNLLRFLNLQTSNTEC